MTGICDGCRRCHRLCPSFDYMLETGRRARGRRLEGRERRLPAHRGPVLAVQALLQPLPLHAAASLRHRLPAADAAGQGGPARARRASRGRTAWLGRRGPSWARSASATAPLTQPARNGFEPHRIAAGGRSSASTATATCRASTTRRSRAGSSERRRPCAAPVTGARRSRSSSPARSTTTSRRSGRDAVAVLEKNGCAVSCPEQVCCGMPYLDGGDIARARTRERAKRNIAALLPLVRAGASVVVPQPTCSYVLQEGVPAAGARARRRTRVAAAHARRLRVPGGAAARRDARTPTFPGQRPGKVAYQMPCHLRAQNMGFKTRDVLQLIPGTEVSVVGALHGHGRHLGHEEGVLSRSACSSRAKAAAEMEAAAPDVVRDRLLAVGPADRGGARQKPAHPITLLREAYGLATSARDDHATGSSSPRSGTSSQYEKRPRAGAKARASSKAAPRAWPWATT